MALSSPRHLGFLGYVGRVFRRQAPVARDAKIPLAIFSAVDQRFQMLACPAFAGSDLAATLTASSFAALENADAHALGNRTVRCSATPLGNGSAGHLFASSKSKSA